MPVEFDGFKFYFDASKIENKKANEKRSLVFQLDEVKEDRTIVFSFQYSEKGTKTKQDEILKDWSAPLESLKSKEKLISLLTKTPEHSYRNSLNSGVINTFWEGTKEWTADRVNQLQILKDIVFKTIDFISQFEDELVKIWNKPKFAKNSNYVITLFGDCLKYSTHSKIYIEGGYHEFLPLLQ